MMNRVCSSFFFFSVFFCTRKCSGLFSSTAFGPRCGASVHRAFCSFFFLETGYISTKKKSSRSQVLDYQTSKCS
ncbi:hypothetical protein V8B55DRAFT_1520694 [Mucor lusitanicus]